MTAPAAAYDEFLLDALPAAARSPAKSVLIVSALWESAPLMLSAPGPHTPLVYDFGGFHPRYYTVAGDRLIRPV